MKSLNEELKTKLNLTKKKYDKKKSKMKDTQNTVSKIESQILDLLENYVVSKSEGLSQNETKKVRRKLKSLYQNVNLISNHKY